ncbi:MvdC/MvdD family ATP grasp protein [Yersinia enterocolitica]|uniref:MvdC/MvdD family ATP grasp protein n=1 Tax=Yersinia enterocolitica TaxID=630 RepID=UPI003F48BB04
MILLVTNKRDITMDYIVVELKKRGVEYFRLNTEDLPKSYSVMSDESLMDWSININGKILNGSNVKAAYFRRPGNPEVPSYISDPNVIDYIQGEWNSFLKSLYMRLELFWFSSPTNVILAEDKPRQLVVAKEIGFNIPESIVTNSHEEIKRVSNCYSAIGKPLRQALFIKNQKESVIFTNRLGQLDDSDSSSLSLVPIIIQREIIKKFDVRVTVVGKSVFPVAIYSQNYEETEVDWRKGSRTDLKHEAIELTPPLKFKCIELVESLNLRFGAIDLICDNNDKFWFLEINPNGQWAWIENQTNLPIASAIVDELIRISRYES